MVSQTLDVEHSLVHLYETSVMSTIDWAYCLNIELFVKDTTQISSFLLVIYQIIAN